MTASGGSGIHSYRGSIEIKGGSVYASATNYAIHAASDMVSYDVIINAGSKVTASGGNKAIFSKVKNAIAGTGWTDTAGTTGEANIAVGEHTRTELANFKKVQFPVAHTHDFTYTASGATITATCSAEGCPLDDGTEQHNHTATVSIAATGASYTGSAYTGASLTDTRWTYAGLTLPTIEYVGSGSTTYEKITTAPTDAGTYTASVTVDTNKTVTADFTISPMALTITGATATNRSYEKDNNTVTISSVSFKDSSQTAVTLTSGTDYTAAGEMTDANVGTSKGVNVTVTLSNANYSLETNTTNTTVDISKADAQTIADVTDTLLYTATSVSESVAGKMPDDAGTLTYSAGSASETGRVTVSYFDVNATSGAVTATLSGGAAGDTVTLPVTIGSTNYADSTVNVKITLTEKGDAGVAISGVPTQAKTYGDADFTLTGSVTNAGTGTGTWTWSTSDDTVFQITPNGATATVKILKSGSATITAKYESDTTIGSKTTSSITVDKKALTVKALDKSIKVGEEVPNLSNPVKDTDYTVTGLVGTDTLTNGPTLAYASQPDNTKAGTYKINASGAAASDNYTIGYQDGTLTISEKSSGGGGTTPSSEYTVPVENEETIQVDANIKDGNAAISEIKAEDIDKITEVKEGQEPVETITIDLSEAPKEVTSVEFTKKTVENLADAVSNDENVESVTIAMTNAVISLDQTTLETIAAEAKGDTVRLVVDEIEPSKLNDSQKEALKSYVDSAPFEVYFESDGKRIESFGGGTMAIAMKFTPESGKDPNHYHIVYLNPNGEVTTYPTLMENGLISTTINHNSEYAIIYDETKENANKEAKAAAEVSELINALPDNPAKATSKQVAEAVAAYKTLTDYQKSLIADTEKDKLVAAVKYPAKARKVTLKSVKAKKGRKATATWKKNSKVSGYQLVYSTSKKFTRKTTKKATIKSYKTVKKTVKKLKAGKKYYFKIRPYTNVDNPVTDKTEKVYGKWSKVKSCKAKK